MDRPPGGGPFPEVAPPPGVTIRPARPGDSRGVVDLLRIVAAEGRFIRRERVDEPTRHFRAGLRRSWSRERAALVAIAEGRVIASLDVGRDGHPGNAHVASLGMAVAPAWRGRGVGSALMTQAFRWAAWAGVEKMALTVYPHNEAAIRLYRKFGFVEEGRLTGQSKKSYGYEDEIVMARWL